MVADADALTAAVGRLLDDPAERQRRAEAAAAVAQRESGVLDAVLTRLAPWLDPLSAEGASGAARPDDTRACA
jgi:3-deoxy-D-manno-octulosonic-acid transferase